MGYSSKVKRNRVSRRRTLRITKGHVMKKRPKKKPRTRRRKMKGGMVVETILHTKPYSEIESLEQKIKDELLHIQNSSFEEDPALITLSELYCSMFFYTEVSGTIKATGTYDEGKTYIDFNSICSNQSITTKGACKEMFTLILPEVLKKKKPVFIQYVFKKGDKAERNIGACKCYYDSGFRYVNSNSELHHQYCHPVSRGSQNTTQLVFNYLDGRKYSLVLLVHKDSTRPTNYNNGPIPNPCLDPSMWEDDML